MKNVRFKFEDLKVYQKAIDFVDYVYDVTKKFPKEEKFQLASQFTRAAISIPLNIAEGSGDTNPQFNRFLQIASNFIKECVVCSSIAKRQSYISKEINQDIRGKLEELSKMIKGLQSYLSKKPKV